ncbi:MAG TPA: VPLPA-CTERM-specific exosortase XrtD [Steroidobacteraceae bacterium]|nr:VPLPA-CTERM-specific exosortase XrtD [Steroidobacteraceae bacterium]
MSVETDLVRLPRAPVWRAPPWLLLVVGTVGLLSLWPFRDGFNDMWHMWVSSEEYNHCLLILPIAAFLIWQRRDRLERLDFTGSWAGVALVLLGGVLLVLGQLGTVYTLVEYGFLMTLYGLVLSWVGWLAFRVMLVPLLILLFMIPLPQFFFYNLSLALQLISSKLGVMFMRLFGVSVLLEGNVIDLGGYKLEVAEACSGLRYLFPLMTLGLLMAYFYKGAVWKRAVLLVSSLPITVLMNSLRVGIIGVSVDRWGPQMAAGLLHEFQGWMIFMLSAALLFLEMIALHQAGTERGSWRQLFAVELPARTSGTAPRRDRGMPRTFLVAAGLIVAFSGIDLLVPRPAEAIPARDSFVSFPMRLGGWQGQRASMEAVYLDQLQLDDYLLANFARGSTAPVNLYISWYNSQRKGQAVHSPRSCLPGGGWDVVSFGPHAVDGVLVGGRALRVNRAVVQLGNDRELVYYWFQQRGRVIDNEFAVKWYLFWDAMFRHRTDGAMVRLISPIESAGAEAQADARLTDLAAKLAPLMSRYIPD